MLYRKETHINRILVCPTSYLIMESSPGSQFYYSEDLEPIATSEEQDTYQSEVQAELEEEEILVKRFSKEVRLDEW